MVGRDKKRDVMETFICVTFNFGHDHSPKFESLQKEKTALQNSVDKDLQNGEIQPANE
jgi:hypothetical protein